MCVVGLVAYIYSESQELTIAYRERKPLSPTVQIDQVCIAKKLFLMNFTCVQLTCICI